MATIRVNYNNMLEALDEDFVINKEGDKPKEVDSDTPYIMLHIINSKTDNLAIDTPELTIKNSIYQITLAFPFGKGVNPIESKANEIIATFQKDTVIVDDGLKATIVSEPLYVSRGKIEDRLVGIVSFDYKVTKI